MRAEGSRVHGLSIGRIGGSGDGAGALVITEDGEEHEPCIEREAQGGTVGTTSPVRTHKVAATDLGDACGTLDVRHDTLIRPGQCREAGARLYRHTARRQLLGKGPFHVPLLQVLLGGVLQVDGAQLPAEHLLTARVKELHATDGVCISSYSVSDTERGRAVRAYAHVSR